MPTDLSAPRWTTDDRKRANRQLLDSIAALWDLVPDQRFGQLVKNLSRQDGCFADTWEWSHVKWNEQMADAYNAWAKALNGRGTDAH